MKSKKNKKNRKKPSKLNAVFFGASIVVALIWETSIPKMFEMMGAEK